jgi:hypothetical protein
VITDVVQRWRDRRDTYRPAREVIDVRRFEVAPLDRDPARSFVEAHHYEGTFPAARFRFGLFEGEELVGVAVFSQPVRDEVTACLPGEPLERTELGRLVLLDHVGANAESWLVARCMEVLRREGLTGFVSFSDPQPRHALDGRVVMPGHLGIVYQSLNGVYLGRSRADRVRLLPDGTNLPNRRLAKIRARDRGWRPAVEELVEYGAAPLRGDEDPRAWLDRELPRITRSLPHPGKHRYAWVLNRRDRRHLPESLPYPKFCGVTSRPTTRAA